MHTVMVTGGAGFIGSHLVERLLRDPDRRIAIVDNLSTGQRGNVPVHPRVELFVADANDGGQMASLFRHCRPAQVLHLAAVVGVERTRARPDDVRADERGIRNLLALSRRHGVRRVFFASSSEVYGEAGTLPQSERYRPRPRNDYATVKHRGEQLCHASGVPWTAFRLFNTYGPRQRADFVVSRFVRQAVAGRPITVDGDGSQRRTFCHVSDTVAALHAVLATGAFMNEVVNVGGECERTMTELARDIRAAAGSRSPIVHRLSDRIGETRCRRPDLAQLRRGHAAPLLPLPAGLQTVVAHERAAREAGRLRTPARAGWCGG